MEQQLKEFDSRMLKKRRPRGLRQSRRTSERNAGGIESFLKRAVWLAAGLAADRLLCVLLWGAVEHVRGVRLSLSSQVGREM